MLELTRNVRFLPNPSISWANRPPEIAVRRNGYVLTDTDNDRVPDTYLPGTSNFAAGWPAEALKPFNRESLKNGPGCHVVDPEALAQEVHCPDGTTYLIRE